MAASIKATIDDLNQYLQGNLPAQRLIITLEDLLNFLKDSEGISENKEFDLKKYLGENKLYTTEESKEEKTVINEGKKPKGYMAELAEIDKQSALVALEAKINKLAEMAEAKTNRLNMVNEDENLSELISKQAVKEMQRSIKEIEKLKEKLLKEFTKKGGKMTEVIDEEIEEGIEDELKKNKGKTWDEVEPAQVAKEKLPTLNTENEEVDEDVVPGSNVRKDKSDDDWEVMSGKTGKPWPQDFKTKKSAAAALRGYHASKGKG